MLKLFAVHFSGFNTTLVAAAAFMLTSCSSPVRTVAPRTQLRVFDHFEDFERTRHGNETVLLSPRLDTTPWNELIVSWNADCPPGTTLKIEARAFGENSATRFYTIGLWSAAPGEARTSLRHERDNDAAIDTDTMICPREMSGAQVRFTLSGTNEIFPRLKFVAFSFLDPARASETNEPNRRAWGKTLEVPERSQLGHAGASGWCSPTSLSMILAYWSQRLGRAELDVPVPEVARAVHDVTYGGTGNWAFNMAYAGSFERMRAYATRFDDLRQVENYIAADIPIALSVSFDLLNGKEQDQNNGHLIVVVGFTETGDVVVNDPWPNPRKENRVRKIFPRAQVVAAWQRSKQTVYLVFPEGTRVPASF